MKGIFGRSRIWPIIKKEYLHIARDKRTLLITFALPFVMLLLYGYALTFDINHIPLVIYDLDNKPATRFLIERFTSSGYFTIVGHAKDLEDENRYIISGRARAALNIRDGFSSDIASGKRAQLQLIVDGADANTAIVAIGYMNGIMQEYKTDLLLKTFAKNGLVSYEKLMPLDVRPRVLYNPELRSMNFLVPGIMSFILMILSAMIISMTVVSEKTRGTMEQLICTSLKPMEIMIGKIMPFIIIGLADVLLCILTSVFIFGVGIKGSLILLFVESLIFIFGTMGLGLLISTMARRQEDALLLASMITFLPSMLLSGFIFPIASMPPVIQVITYFIPARYFIDILRGIFLKGVGIEYLWLDTLLLSAFALMMIVLASKHFKKRLD